MKANEHDYIKAIGADWGLVKLQGKWRSFECLGCAYALGLLRGGKRLQNADFPSSLLMRIGHKFEYLHNKNIHARWLQLGKPIAGLPNDNKPPNTHNGHLATCLCCKNLYIGNAQPEYDEYDHYYPMTISCQAEQFNHDQYNAEITFEHLHDFAQSCKDFKGKEETKIIDP